MSTSEPGLPFTTSAERQADDYDVVMIYEMLFGRPPENERVMEEAKSQPIQQFMMSALTSDEFQGLVQILLKEKGALPHLRFSKGPTKEQIGWFLSLLNLTSNEKEGASRITNWSEFITFVLALRTRFGARPSPLDNRAEPEPHRSEPPVRTPALAETALSAPARDVVVVVESSDQFHVKGWGLDLRNRDQPLALSVRLDGALLGTVRCDAVRHDLRRAIGGSGACGFAFDLGPARASHILPSSKLTIHEDESGTMVAGPLSFPAAREANPAAIEPTRAFAEWLASSMAALKATVSTLRDEVEDLKAAAQSTPGRRTSDGPNLPKITVRTVR